MIDYLRRVFNRMSESEAGFYDASHGRPAKRSNGEYTEGWKFAFSDELLYIPIELTHETPKV